MALKAPQRPLSSQMRVSRRLGASSHSKSNVTASFASWKTSSSITCITANNSKAWQQQQRPVLVHGRVGILPTAVTRPRRRQQARLAVTASSSLQASAAAAAAVPPSLVSGSSFRGTAVVVGAGPAGATAAMYLAAAGFRVHVLERRGHPGQQEADQKRTYLIGLGERGLRALDGLGLQVPPGAGRTMLGSVYAYKNGKRIEDPFTPDTRIVGVDRQGLSAFLVDEAALRFPQAVTFHWHAAPAALDLQARTVTWQEEQQPQPEAAPRTQQHQAALADDGSSSSSSTSLPLQQQQQQQQQQPQPGELHYDLLVGADGAGSIVRDTLVRALPDIKVTRLTSPVAEMEYKAFHNLPWNDKIRALLPQYAASTKGSSGSSTPDDVLSGGMTFFAFNNPQPNQPSPGSITLYLNARGTWSGTVYQPPGRYDVMAGDAAAHEAAIRQFTPDTFPIQEWVPLMAQQMVGMEPSRIKPMQVVSRLAAPQLGVVLLGDAAHNVTPQMGQGCNSALEDCKLLSEALTSNSYNIPAALKAYDQSRRPQVHALQHMEEENAWVRRPAQPLKDPLDKSLARVAWISCFMLLPALRLLPGLRHVVHASLFQNIMSTTMPYNQLHLGVRTSPLLLCGVLAALVAAVKALLGLVGRLLV